MIEKSRDWRILFFIDFNFPSQTWFWLNKVKVLYNYKPPLGVLLYTSMPSYYTITNHPPEYYFPLRYCSRNCYLVLVLVLVLEIVLELESGFAFILSTNMHYLGKGNIQITRWPMNQLSAGTNPNVWHLTPPRPCIPSGRQAPKLVKCVTFNSVRAHKSVNDNCSLMK